MKKLDYGLLLEIYGPLLTEKQRGFMELYYWEDLSLGEIAQSAGVTRQAVMSSIKRSEQLLIGYDIKLGLMEKIKQSRIYFEGIIENTALYRSSNDDVSRETQIQNITETAKRGSKIF